MLLSIAKTSLALLSLGFATVSFAGVATLENVPASSPEVHASVDSPNVPEGCEDLAIATCEEGSTRLTSCSLGMQHVLERGYCKALHELKAKVCASGASFDAEAVHCRPLL